MDGKFFIDCEARILNSARYQSLGWTEAVSKAVRSALQDCAGASPLHAATQDSDAGIWRMVLQKYPESGLSQQDLSALEWGDIFSVRQGIKRASVSLRPFTPSGVVARDASAAKKRVPNVTQFHDETIYHAWGPAEQRHAEKQMQLAMHYGMAANQLVWTQTGRQQGKSLSWQRIKRMWNRNIGSPFARAVENGPFKIEPYNGRRSKVSGGAPAYKVVNRFGVRVHRGSYGSCQHKEEELNFEHAKWIMLKP